MLERLRRWWVMGLVLVGMALAAVSGLAASVRAVKVKVDPVFPALARRLNLRGTVKLIVTVAPNGSVVGTKVAGGNPILAQSAVEAVKKWRFEAGPDQTTEVVSIDFAD